MFPRELYKIAKKIFFVEQLRATASVPCRSSTARELLRREFPDKFTKFSPVR